MIESRVSRPDGVELALYRWPSAEGRPTVLLVHGYPDNAAIWRKVAEPLSRGFNVAAYDVRGAGRSTAPDSTAGYAHARLSADLVAIADEISPDRPAHIVGHDWGSMQAWEPVTEPALRPRIASFTSMSGPYLDHVGWWVKERLQRRSPAALREVLSQLRRSWYIGMFLLPAIAPAMWKMSVGRRWPRMVAAMERLDAVEPSPTQTQDGAHGVNLYRANVLKSVRHPRERSTTVPVQLLVATRDKFVSAALLADVQRWAPDLRRHDVDAGHWLPLTRPAWVAERVGSFVRDVERSSPR